MTNLDVEIDELTMDELNEVSGGEGDGSGRVSPLQASVEAFEGPFGDGFSHVEGWVPQRLVTATGPNPLPRP